MSTPPVTFEPTCPLNAHFLDGQCTWNVRYVYINGVCKLSVP